jgi:exopolysaccharide biosynthesis polyprenyl glycosylphosphotransferase
VTLGLLLADAAGLGAAFALGYLLRFKSELLPYDGPHSIGFYSSVGFWAVPVFLAFFAAYHLYDRRYLFAGFSEYVRVANACTIGIVAVVLISFLRGVDYGADSSISRGWLLATWLLSIGLIVLGRFVFRRFVRMLRTRGRLLTPTLIVGVNEEGIALAEQLLGDPGSGAQLLGFLDSALPAGTPVGSGLEVLGDFWKLDVFIERHGVQQVIVATSALTREQLLDLYWNFGQDDGLELHLSSGLFEILTTSVQVQEISRVPLVTPQRVRITGADALIKTTLDYVLAGAALIALLPVVFVVCIAIKLDSRGPIFHSRRVLGVSGKAFGAYKFRTMMLNAERRQMERPIGFAERRLNFKSPDDPRITRVGRFLRRTSLDELPQLINVLRGEMSLVGPRMIAPEEAARYGKWQRNLVTVKPGITGPWQVAGRGDLPYEQRITLSMQYIRNYTFWLDLAILVRTVFVVLKGRGAY